MISVGGGDYGGVYDGGVIETLTATVAGVCVSGPFDFLFGEIVIVGLRLGSAIVRGRRRRWWWLW